MGKRWAYLMLASLLTTNAAYASDETDFLQEVRQQEWKGLGGGQ
ncbi:hypothetical protein [Solemya velesiana gill symbiont]|nr:hypothetical protein [Solemya velesiana gill symbiont]